jgi:hypothetical protein
MSVVRVFRKYVPERKRLYLDYSCWLEDAETLTDFQVTVNPYTVEGPLALTVGYTDVTNKKLAIFVGGGIANTNYVMQMLVRTDQGQVKRDDIGMRVNP